MSTSMPSSCALALSACVACSHGDASTQPPVPVDQTRDGVHLNPYHAVVRRKVLHAFRGLTAHDPAPALSLMTADVHYTFEGEHALGGTRVTRAGVQKWFTRLLRLLPGQFVIREVTVKGWPWATRVITRFDHYVAPPDEPPYWGAGVQITRLRWGKATSIRTYVETARLEKTLRAIAERGEPEAMAAPIRE